MQIPVLRMKSGYEIPVLGLGTWMLNGQACTDAVRAALKLGYNHIDTAEAYGNQREIGRAIKGADRAKIFITSKVWHANLHYDDVIESAKNTLAELGTPYLDLLLVHWPNRSVPIEETMDAFAALIGEGAVKSIGVSNFTVRHLKEALQAAKAPISVNQVEFHPHLYQVELLEFCRKNGIVLTAYSPLGRKKLLEDDTITGIAEKNSKTPAQACLNWTIGKGAVAIPKASAEAHLKENLGALGWSLHEEDVKKLDALGEEKRIVNPSFSEFD